MQRRTLRIRLAVTRRSAPFVALLAGLALWLGGSVGVALWVDRQIEGAVLERTAAVTGLYVQTIFEPHLQSLARAPRVDAAGISAIERVMAGTELAASTIALKVWSPDGEIVYSPNARLIGQRFPVAGDLAEAVRGSTALDISDLRDPENVYERGTYPRLLEAYVPVRDQATGRVIGAAEVYQLPDQVATEIATAERASWLGIGAGALLSYLVVAWLLLRAWRSRTRRPMSPEGASGPPASPAARVGFGAPSDGSGRPRRLRLAAMRLIERTDAEHREIDAALFNGPGQHLAAALMGVEAIRAGLSEEDRRRAGGDLALVDHALTGALAEMRQIAAGFRMPDLADLDPAGVVDRAIRAARRGTGGSFQTVFGDLPPSAAPALKIALFLAIREAIAYAVAEQGATSISVIAGSDDGVLSLRVAGQREPSGDDADDGLPSSGADWTPAATIELYVGFELSPGLILAREQAIVLGGTFSARPAPNHGVVVTATWPLADDPGASAPTA